VLREQPNCRAICLIPSPLRAITRISTACSWVNIDGQKAAIVAQVGQFHFGTVGQFRIGANIQSTRPREARLADDAAQSVVCTVSIHAPA
jgi:hypothetical protein